MSGWVYMLSNKPHGVLYTGVTANITQRIWLHRERRQQGFTQRYNCHRLVRCENHDAIEAAIHREKCIKEWKRAWKIELIEAANPKWDDLYETIL